MYAANLFSVQAFCSLFCIRLAAPDVRHRAPDRGREGPKEEAEARKVTYAGTGTYGSGVLMTVCKRSARGRIKRGEWWPMATEPVHGVEVWSSDGKVALWEIR